MEVAHIHALINSISWHLASLIKYGHSISIQLHRGLMLLSCIASQVRDRNQSKEAIWGLQNQATRSILTFFLIQKEKKPWSINIYLWSEKLIKILNVNFDLRIFCILLIRPLSKYIPICELLWVSIILITECLGIWSYRIHFIFNLDR